MKEEGGRAVEGTDLPSGSEGYLSGLMNKCQQFSLWWWMGRGWGHKKEAKASYSDLKKKNTVRVTCYFESCSEYPIFFFLAPSKHTTKLYFVS